MLSVFILKMHIYINKRFFSWYISNTWNVLSFNFFSIVKKILGGEGFNNNNNNDDDGDDKKR